MVDRELLLERLERLAIVLDELMSGCAELVRDAIALLKEQEPSKIVMSPFDEEWYGSTLECTTCGCRWMMSDDAHVCCCPHCGRKVKWE